MIIKTKVPLSKEYMTLWLSCLGPLGFWLQKTFNLIGFVIHFERILWGLYKKSDDVATEHRYFQSGGYNI